MSAKQHAILIGAIVTALLSTSYLGIINVFCCLGTIIGGIVATWQYARLTETTFETGDGAVLGAGAGALGSVFATLLDRLLRPLGLDGQSLITSGLERVLDLQAMQQIRQQMEAQQQSQSFITVLFSLILGVVVYAVFGAIGGAIGAAFFGSADETA